MANGLVRSAPIVEVDVFLEPGLGLRDAAVGSQVYVLVLDGFPQALDDDVVPPATLAVHGDLNLVVF